MSSLSDADSWSYSSSNEFDDASPLAEAEVANAFNHFQFHPLQRSESGDSDGSGDEEGLAQRIGHAEWFNCIRKSNNSRRCKPITRSQYLKT
ncbi:hypothetical protein MTO96_051820 [Rhipicephalus appendiculatus]